MRMENSGSVPETLLRFRKMGLSKSSVTKQSNKTFRNLIFQFMIILLNLFETFFADRKKDLVKLQFGEYVSLGKVESEMKTCPLVENICVYGDGRKNYTVALVVPNQRNLEEVANNLGIVYSSFEDLCNNPDMEQAVLKILEEHSKKRKLKICNAKIFFGFQKTNRIEMN